MDAPDELRQAVAEAINRADNAWGWAARDPELHGGALTPPWQQYVADAVLSVPGIADALAAQAALERARAEFTKVPRDETPAFIHATLHGLLYPEAGK